MKFDLPTKWYMHKPASILDKEMQKILWDFEMQKEHLILARREDQVIVNNNNNNKKKKRKENLLYRWFCRPGGPQIKDKRIQKMYLDLVRELEIAVDLLSLTLQILNQSFPSPVKYPQLTPTGKCARNLNLTMPTNGIGTTQHLS